MDKLGEFRLPHFPNQHKVFSVLFKETAKQPNIVIPKKFGKYEVAEAIKENQLYSTFRGYDPHLERSVIIKAYKAQAFADFKEFTSLRKQFYEEVRKLNRINHPNIGVIYDAGEEGEILYLVRECVDGKILNDYLLQSGLPDVKTTLAFYLQVCKILIVFHQSQTWHKNLKPDNVFITNQNEIKLVDGGLLQVRHTDKIWNSDINSQAYSAPEQIQGHRLTQSCDNFQLGVMLYESLTGVHPFRGKDAAEVRIKILANDPLPASTFRADIPAALDAILEKSLAKNPHQRYESIPAFSADLSKLAANEKETTAKRLLQILK
jgi:serine/threonine-protein kinase